MKLSQKKKRRVSTVALTILGLCQVFAVEIENRLKIPKWLRYTELVMQQSTVKNTTLQFSDKQTQ